MTAEEVIHQIQSEIDLRAERASDLIIGGNCLVIFKQDLDNFITSLRCDIEKEAKQ